VNQRSLGKAREASTRRPGAARALASLGVALALCGSAHAQAASGIERLVTSDAARALASDDAVTRGEAALVVAMGGARRHQAEVLELASDPAPAARRRALLALGLMATPEAVQRVAAAHPDARVYAGRLDRGLSSERALRSEPGTFADEERGLNDVQYIVPGAGGMGELLTNSWV